ncbi:MAG: glycosyltransferase [Candidatus Peribacteraceae bacterium]|nr:glycosyltransferase [Candidatus Peribacteraceae bacterium]MDD5739309.1 glycosyltransferase [Candidatus Peribacteraceae bacterium]
MLEKTVLVNLNVSNDSNFEADSGYIFQKLLWTHLCEMRRNLRVLFLGHRLNTEQWHPNISMIPFHTKFDKFSTRLHFDWHALKDRFQHLPQVDLLYNNQPESTLNFKTLLSSMYGKEIPAVSYYHYLPFHYDAQGMVLDPSQNLHGFSAVPILGRNLEALELSDKAFIGSAFGRDILLRAYRERYRAALDPQLEVFSPPIESELFTQPKRKNGMPHILYNQRLYKHYGTQQVIDAVRQVASTRDIHFVVTDPTGERSLERNRLDPGVRQFREDLGNLPFVDRIHCSTRQQYHALLSRVDLGIAPVKPSALWSMAVADILATGNPVLCPNVGAFPELVPHTPELLFAEDGSDLPEKISATLDRNGQADPETYKANVRRYDAPAMAREMLGHLSPFLT